ncbi:DNA-binding MarR family transcriptional regulator [Kribbella sp. VKM Ac-2566]|nr:DNA-binding MarR family transcriptional regulator [Kribbella sp. VKM Ac-2566]
MCVTAEKRNRSTETFPCVTQISVSANTTDSDNLAAEVNVLANLADGRPRTVSEIGVAAGVRPTTLTGVLDRLADKGLLTRATRTGDRRAVEISLTAAGARSAARVAQAFKGVEMRALDGVPESAVKQTRRVLKALTES